MSNPVPSFSNKRLAASGLDMKQGITWAAQVSKNDAITKMSQCRGYIIDYLVFGTENGVPEKFKKRLKELEKASERGEIKATIEILNRVAGKPLQNVDINVSEKKLIIDDTTAKQLPAGSPAQKATYRVIDAEHKKGK